MNDKFEEKVHLDTKICFCGGAMSLLFNIKELLIALFGHGVDNYTEQQLIFSVFFQ